MQRSNIRKNLVVVAASAALLLAACGQSATAELMLMDAPPPGVSSVKIWVASMQVHVDTKDKAHSADDLDPALDDSPKWHSLVVDKAIDLVQHQGESAAAVLGRLELPAGKITQVRLVVDTAKPNTATKDGVECDLDLSKVAAKGIKINHVFKAVETKIGSKHQILVDLPLDESLKEDGTCFRLEAKLKLVKVKTDGKEEAL